MTFCELLFEHFDVVFKLRDVEVDDGDEEATIEVAIQCYECGKTHRGLAWLNLRSFEFSIADVINYIFGKDLSYEKFIMGHLSRCYKMEVEL